MLGHMPSTAHNYHDVPDSVVARYRKLLARKARPGSDSEGQVAESIMAKMRERYPGVDLRAEMPQVDLDDLGLADAPPPPPGAQFESGRQGFWGGVASFARGVFDSLSVQQAAADLSADTVRIRVKGTQGGLRVTIDIDAQGIATAQHWGDDGLYAFVESIGAGVTVEIIDAIE